MLKSKDENSCTGTILCKNLVVLFSILKKNLKTKTTKHTYTFKISSQSSWSSLPAISYKRWNNCQNKSGLAWINRQEGNCCVQIPARQDPHQDSLLATALVTQTDTMLVPAEFSAWPAPHRDNTFNNSQNNSPVSNAALPHAFPLPGEWRRCCSSTRAHMLASALPSSILGKIQKELAIYCPGQFFGILLDLLRASTIASVVAYASSSHPCSLTDWNKEKPLYFYLYSKFCSGLFSLPFFTNFPL